MRLRTGYEMVIPQKTSSVFVGRAKKDGIVTAIDDTLKLVTVMYKDKSTDVFEYGEIHGEASGQVVNHQITTTPNIKVGAKVPQDSVITYHKEFFQLDPSTHQLAWCHGIPVNVAIMPKDVTLEDSCMISNDLANKMGFDSIYVRPVQITTDMIITDFAEIGSKVSYNDPLIKLKYEDTADVIGDVDELFAELKQISYQSKHDGEIVGIQVFHVAESLNMSLTKFVNKINLKGKRKANFAKGSLKEDKYTPATIVPDGTRIRGVQLSGNDILVVFHIKSRIACGIGDKIVLGNMLKSVIGKIEHEPITTEEGKVVDIVFGANSIYDRLVLSVFLNGISDTMLADAEHDILELYFNN